MNRRPALSERLGVLADLVIPGKPMADIGTDHGLLPYACLSCGRVPFAILSDVNEGPLRKARELMDHSGIGPDRCSLRLGSGLSVLEPGEACTVVIAGMGGELIARLLEDSPAQTFHTERLVLQPRSRSGMLRTWLWKNGWRIREERLARERGRICQILAAEKGFQEPYQYADIPDCTDPLMLEFLDREIVNIRIVIENLRRSKDASQAESIEERKGKMLTLEKRREDLWKSNCF